MRVQHHLQAAKEARLEKSHTPEELKTPPPKLSMRSPGSTPPPPPVPKSDAPQVGSGEKEKEVPDTSPESVSSESLVCCSQREYFGRKGQSWWGPGHHDYPAESWFWDPYKNRYVVTQGDRCWFEYPEEWGQSWWDRSCSDQDPSDFEECLKQLDESPKDTNTPPGGDDDNVRDALVTRKPTVYSPESPMEVEPGLNEEASEGPAGEPDHETETPGDSARSKPGKSEAWRLDKKGNPISPEALYMRFYRRLRSALA